MPRRGLLFPIAPYENADYTENAENDMGAGMPARLWRNDVLARDGYECVRCGSTKGLHAHHIVRWIDAPDLRVVLENGETLSETCHRRSHGKVF